MTCALVEMSQFKKKTNPVVLKGYNFQNHQGIQMKFLKNVGNLFLLKIWKLYPKIFAGHKDIKLFRLGYFLRHPVLPFGIYQSWKKLPKMPPATALGRILVAQRFVCRTSWWASCFLHQMFLPVTRLHSWFVNCISVPWYLTSTMHFWKSKAKKSNGLHWPSCSTTSESRQWCSLTISMSNLLPW